MRGKGALAISSSSRRDRRRWATDSPVGQAAWIYEKLWAWTDNQGNPDDALTLGEMLDNIMLYWLPGTATSSARLYWESFAMGVASVRLEISVGVSVYPRETLRPSRRWVRSVDAEPDPLQHPGSGATSPPGSNQRCTRRKSASAKVR